MERLLQRISVGRRPTLLRGGDWTDKHKRKLDEQDTRKQKSELKASKGDRAGNEDAIVEEEEKKEKGDAEVDAVVQEAGLKREGIDRKRLEVPIKKKAKTPFRKEDARQRRARERFDIWEPKTRLGNMVRNKEIIDIGDALATGLPIREPEIVDILIPDLEDEVLDVNMVQRMTDSGRRVRFSIIAVVGNKDGYVGLGQAKGKEVGPAIRKAIDNAKMKLIEIKRGCGSWECGCGTGHSIPFKVDGKCGSIKVIFKPAPRGIDLAVGDVAKHIMRMAGVKDAWGFTTGKTKTTVNYAKAVFDALKKTASMRVMKHQTEELNIVKGKVES